MEPGATMIRGTLLPAGRRWAGFVCLSWAAACAPPPQPEPKAASAGEWRAFEGTWSAAGKRHTLKLGPDHQASSFYLTGSLLNADMNAVLGATLVVGAVYVGLNLLADLAYRLLDPRVR